MRRLIHGGYAAVINTMPDLRSISDHLTVVVWERWHFWTDWPFWLMLAVMAILSLILAVLLWDRWRRDPKDIFPWRGPRRDF